MTWPRSRIRTYSAGLPVFAGDLNRLQDAAVNNSHGLITWPHKIAERIVVGGAWSISNSTVFGVGSLLEASNGSVCFVSFVPAPCGSRLTGFGLRIKDGGGTSLARLRIMRDFDTGTPTPIGSVDSTGSGALEVVWANLAGAEYEVPTPAAATHRWYAELSTTGGGGTSRRFYEFYTTWYRP